MTDAAKPEPGWYVILRKSDGALACLHFDGWRWQLGHRNSTGLPCGWRLGPRVDELLSHAEANIDPQIVANG